VPRKGSTQLLAELAAQIDGIHTKPVGIWSLWKLAALHLYFEAFTKACASAGGGYYVDGFAGPGVCRVRDSNPPYFAWGSPLLALRTTPRFERCLFVDLDPRAVTALRARTFAYGGRGETHLGDVNVLVPNLIQSEVPGWAPCFCLLDQQGGELAWETVARIAGTRGRHRKPELMILFPLRMALLRLLSVGRSVSEEFASRWDTTMGSHEWFGIYQARVRGNVSPSEAQTQYLALYSDALKGLGYKHVTSREITAPRAPGLKRQGMYHLFFATDHEAGFKIMSDVFRRPYSLDFPVTRQKSLFE
jgi:three-Cys-motif partner protein